MKNTLAVAYGAFVLTTLTPISAAKPAPLAPPDPSRGVIGVRIKVIPPARMGHSYCEDVYFVRVVEDADRFGAESLIDSNYTDGRDVYLLNVKPGRYVAVGCKLGQKSGPVGPALPAGPGFQVGLAISPEPGTAVFSKADILQTEVEVRAGAVVFMGAIEATSSTKTHESDEAQAHYLRKVSPAAAKQGFMARVLTGNLAYIAAFKSVERGEAAETEFWDESIEKRFTDERAWASRIARRSSPPVVGAASATATGASSSGDAFLSAVCVDVNKVKARANGQPKEAAEIARLVCQTVMTDWRSQGCRENPTQDLCKKRLASFDRSLKSSGSSMLFAAAQAGQASICSVMLAMGSDPNAPISTGQTPATIAAESGHQGIVELLAKASVETPAEGDTGAAAVAAAPAIEEARTAMKSGDYGTALRILPSIAEGGDPVAQNMLGVLYIEGWGVEQDHAMALSWLRKSADQGDMKGAYNLGRMYDNAWGVPKDFVQAVKWYRVSADKGYPLAQSILGAMYATGNGVPQDHAEAMKWYRLAADQGEPEAQRRVGLMYAEGQGVSNDDVQALSWYRKAADQGNVGGEYWVGRFYLEGRGVEKNPELAKEWLGKAAAQGNAEAQQLLTVAASPVN